MSAADWPRRGWGLIAALWRFVRRFEIRVLIAVALIAGALNLFIELGDDVGEGDYSDLDRRLILMMRTPGDPTDPIGSRSIEEAVRDMTALGGTLVVTLVTIIAVLAFAFHNRWKHALVMGGGVLLATLSIDLTKALYGRPRPDLVPHGSYVYSGSFPSGHSAMAAATFLILAVLISSLEPRRRTKALAYGVAAAVLVAAGVSRVYLGVHWPSDVVAGWCLGSVWALAAFAVLRLIGGRTRG